MVRRGRLELNVVVAHLDEFRHLAPLSGAADAIQVCDGLLVADARKGPDKPVRVVGDARVVCDGVRDGRRKHGVGDRVHRSSESKLVLVLHLDAVFHA